MATLERTTGLKIVVLGAGAVGKSAIVIRLVANDWRTEYDPTIEDSYTCTIRVNGRDQQLDLLDTAGQDHFAALRNHWMREGEAFAIVYCVNSARSFKQADYLMTLLKRIKEDERIDVVLVANKGDLPENQHEVTTKMGQELAKTWAQNPMTNAAFFQMSAKTGNGVMECFQELCRLTWKSVDYDVYEQVVSEQKNDKKPRNCKKLLKKGCIGCVYICLCGWIVHLIYLCLEKMKDVECCHKADEDNYDGIQDRIKRQERKLVFPKVNYVEQDVLKDPILSLKNFKIRRKFSGIRFIKSLLCGVTLPIVIIFQTGVFLTYSQEEKLFFYELFYPFNYQYDSIYHALLLDFLGLVVGRYPDQDPDAVKDRSWFLKQSKMQKLKRFIITIFACLAFFICCYNIWAVWNDPKLSVSLMESIGPFVLFWIIWLLLSCWIAYESKLEPPMPPTYRLRSIKLYLGEKYTHMTDANKFLRAYAWSRNKSGKLRLIHTVIIIFVGLLYACIPGLTRLTIGDDSDELERKTFTTSKEWRIHTGALFVNFIFISSFIYAIEVQYSKHFDNYREWMYDLTMLLNKITKSDGKSIEDEDKHYMPQKGRNFSKDIFLSLERKSNGLGWLEIRSFLAAEGKLLFAEQELPTLWILLITVTSAIYLTYRVFFLPGHPLQSILFNAASILCIICLLSLIRITITGYQFDYIQAKQEMLIGEQRFFLQCHGKGDHEEIANKNINQHIKNHNGLPPPPPLDDSSIKGETNNNKQRKKLNDFVAAEIEMNTMDEKEEKRDIIISDHDHDAAILIQSFYRGCRERGEYYKTLQQAKTAMINREQIAFKVEIDQEESDEETKDMESEPLLSKSNVNKNEMGNLNYWHSELLHNSKELTKSGFIDNMLFIVQRKDVYPRLWNVKLNSVLAKAIVGVIVSGTAAAFKLLF